MRITLGITLFFALLFTACSSNPAPVQPADDGSPVLNFAQVNPADYDIVFDIDLPDGQSFEVDVVNILTEIAADPVRYAAWAEWTGLPYNGIDGTTMTDEQILYHISGQVTYAVFKTWGEVGSPPLGITGCDIYSDYVVPQLFGFHEANPFLMWPQFSVWHMEMNGYDFKNYWSESDDLAPC